MPSLLLHLHTNHTSEVTNYSYEVTSLLNASARFPPSAATSLKAAAASSSVTSSSATITSTSSFFTEMLAAAAEPDLALFSALSA
mmetsp:Transcript_2375/g.5201  ORF Transcript_2375/g.5201 Transcript_2375/m.5201 type:complete len:85 (-) Transcript_2375:159-413(-)